MSKLRLLLFATAVFMFLAAIQLHTAPPAAAAATPTEAGAVLNFATDQLDKPYKLGADGMRRFDCSGLVFRTFLKRPAWRPHRW